VHGAEAARTATEVSALLFGKGEASKLSASALRALAAEVPFVELEGGAAESEGGSLDVLELFVATKLAASKGAARRLLEQGGLNVNGKRLGASDRTIAREELLPGGHLLLRKGARDYALVRVEG
jgi:tyrosyl-tRNA synthetase